MKGIIDEWAREITVEIKDRGYTGVEFRKLKFDDIDDLKKRIKNMMEFKSTDPEAIRYIRYKLLGDSDAA